jgi:protein-tyrosine phosphatase
MFAWLPRSSKRSSERFPFGTLTALLVAVALVAGGAVGWNSHFKQRFIPKRLAQVNEGLWRSGQISSVLVRNVLIENDIGLIVDLTYPDMSDPDQLAEFRAAKEMKIEHLRLPLNGSGEGDIRYYADAIEALDRAERGNTPALVHCAAGSRRSGGVVATYQVLVKGLSPSEAYFELDRYGSRPVAESPLLPFLNSHMAELVALLVERKVISEVPDPLPRFEPPTS